MEKILIAYVPVIHRGYLDLFRRHPYVSQALILGTEILSEFKELRKDIRALRPEDCLEALQALHAHPRLGLADLRTIAALRPRHPAFILPNDEVCAAVASRYMEGCRVIPDSHFLRWDSKSSLEEKPVRPDETITTDELHRSFIQRAEVEAQKSADWWRQVGGVLVKDGELVMAAYNQHLPDNDVTAYNGDPRSNFKKGLHFEISLALHAEAAIVARAAASEYSIRGASLYVTTFPCPPCARVIAFSGISTLYFKDGYSVFDGEEVLRQQGVKIIRVQ